MPVSVTRNLWTEAGIANGTRGVLLGILFVRNQVPPGVIATAEHVDAAIVQLDAASGYRGPSISTALPRVVALSPVSAAVDLPSQAHAVRTQLPLRPDVARTVHRCQGLTLPKAVITIGARCTTHGVAFTALSRTRRLDDMLLQPFPLQRHTAGAGGARPPKWVPRLARLLAALTDAAALA